MPSVYIHIHGRQIRQCAKDSVQIAGGILFVADNKVLVLKRSKSSNRPGEWDLPGGKAEPGEDAKEAAIRETIEEIGADLSFRKESAKIYKISRTADEVDYTTFICYCDEFKPVLNDEHSKYRWVELDDLPKHLHPHLKDLLEDLIFDPRQNYPSRKSETFRKRESLLSRAEEARENGNYKAAQKFDATRERIEK